MNIYFLGKPLFIWLGILTYILLTFTIFLGLNVRKFGFKFHKIIAILTFLSATLHLILGAINWIF